MASFVKADIVTSSNQLPELQERLQRTPGLHMTISDVSDRAIPGVDRVSFPKASAVTTQNSASSMTLQSQTYGLDELLLNIERGHYFSVKRSLAKESKVDIINDQLTQGMAAILNDRDSSIHDALLAGAGESVVYTAAIIDDIISARTKLVDNKAWQPGEMFLALNSADFAKVLKSDLFQSAEKLGGAMNPAVDGIVGMIMGFKVVEHTYASSLAYNRKGAAYANHGEADIGTSFDAANVADVWAESLKFGVKVLQSGEYIAKFVVS